jgi:DNA-binding SARP family transcriptional activator
MKTLYLLGQMLLDHGDSATLLTADRAHQVLLYLACQETWLDRGLAADVFWPGHSREGALRNLRKALHNIRRIGLASELVTFGHLIRIDVRTDRQAFIDDVNRGNFELAVNRYRGKLGANFTAVGDIRFGNWLDGERGKLQSLWRRAAHGALPQLDDIKASEVACALLDDDGLDEVALRATVRSLVGVGSASEARRVVIAADLRFKEELGTTLSATTKALLEQLGLHVPL